MEPKEKNGATPAERADMPPELERIWNAIAAQAGHHRSRNWRPIAHYQARNGMRRKVKRTLLLVACALLVCGCALATGIKLWDLKVGVIDGTLAIFRSAQPEREHAAKGSGHGLGRRAGPGAGGARYPRRRAKVDSRRV